MPPSKRNPADLIDEVLDAVLDGTPLDWDRAESGSGGTPAFLRQLKVVAAVAAVHRAASPPEPELCNDDRSRTEQTVDFIPSVWGHLRILERVGSGSFGEVYRAWDTRLDREVALKLVPAGRDADGRTSSSIIHEGRLLARVRHPNVVTIHGAEQIGDRIGLWMEFIHGRTLEQLLQQQTVFSAANVVEIGRELCRAVAAVHGAGLLHRDIKTHNVMCAEDGRIVLMDFGTGRELDEDASSDLAGTPLYLAPEVLQGQQATIQSDIYSLGVLLYRLVTGSYPVHAQTVRGVRRAHEHGERTAVRTARSDVPRKLALVIERAINPQSERRYQDADALVADLAALKPRSTVVRLAYAAAMAAAILLAVTVGWEVWGRQGGLQRWSGPPAATIRAIAVLPLEDLSRNDTDHTYFVDGMTEQLITDLATISGLRVISRTSVMHYKTSRKPMPEVAQELQVDGVIEGSVVLAGDSVRITARLIEGVSGDVLWAKSFEGDVRNVLALQHEVARAISSKVGITLTPQEQARLGAARSVDPEVHRQVLLGWYHANKRTEEGLRSAVGFFKAANGTDPGYAPAYAGLAAAYTELSGFYLDPRQAMSQARRAAETAIQLDETLAEAHAALGYVHLAFDWDGPAAEQSLRRALDLNPTLVTARLTYAAYLTTQQRHDDAVREIRRAVNLDPLSIHTHTFGATLLNFTRRYDEAIELARHGLELEPDSGLTIAIQGVAYAEQRRFREAFDSLERAVRMDSSLTILALQAQVLAVAGRKAEAEKTLRHIEDAARSSYFRSCKLATVYIGLGDLDTAAALFRKGIDERADCMPWLGVEPSIDPFRADSRYLTLLRDIGLAPEVR